MNLRYIIENYKRLSTPELLALAKDPAALEPEVIPYLQAELIVRGKKEEALLLSDHLISPPPAYSDYTPEELRQIIHERLESGESIESIRLDLKEKGVDMLALLEEEVQFKNQTFQFITSLKDRNVGEAEISGIVGEEFGLSYEEAEELKMQLRRKGGWNLVIGWTCIVIALALFLATAAEIGRGFFFHSSFFLLLGIWRITEGYRQRR